MTPQFFWSAVCTGALFGALTAWPQATTAPTATAAGPGVQTPVRQPHTSPPPSAPVPQRDQTTSPSPAQPTPESNAQASMPESDTQDDASQPASRDAGEVDASATTQRRVAEAAANGDTDEQMNGRDCTRLRGLEKSECERRDNARDDLPAGVTDTQKP